MLTAKILRVVGTAALSEPSSNLGGITGSTVWGARIREHGSGSADKGARIRERGASIAQLVERVTCNHKVSSSTLDGG